MNKDDWKVWAWFPIVLGIALLGVNKADAEVSVPQARFIFETLTPGGVVFSITNSKDVQAESSSNTVAVYSGMLHFATSRDEIALVIGHELGHIAHGDFKSQRYDFAAEYSADLYGFKLARTKGYDVCKAIKIFKRFGYNELQYRHPSGSDRYNALIKYC